MQLLRKYSSRLFVLLAGIIISFNTAHAGNGGGGQVKALAVLDGSRHQIQKDSSITVEDSAFYDPAYSGQLNKSYTVQNQVTLMINEASTLYMHDKFNVTVKLFISWLDSAGTLDTTTRSFTIGYDSAKTYNSRSSFVFQGAHKVTVKVVSDSTDATGWDPTALLLIENQLTTRPSFLFQCNSTVSNITVSPSGDPAGDELPVSWNAILGADQYDLEWTYVDITALRIGRYGNAPNYDPAVIFRNNSTRITTTGTSYNIPLMYDDSGTLFIRVRPTQLGNAGSVTAAIWSSDAQPVVMGHYDFLGHERPLNWQSNISFAEEGKRKVVLQYFDGSLRGRQTVTKDNTTNTTIVGETYYDYQGRPAIQVMPAPTLSNVIKYTAGFNVSFNAAEYSQANYDTLIGTTAVCDIHADSMNSTAGASQYYSPNNPQANIGLNQFIPDAQYYPFTETEYTQDNTGRINRQGGVGKYHQLGSGHETKYYYGTPDQNELDALFGTEVGDKSHYFKNMVRDANGQYSVSYVDMHGRTIATALSGLQPSTMAPLASNNTTTITETLADSGSASFQDQSMVSQKSLLVSKADSFAFRYSLLPDSLNELNCNQQSICYTCRYDLDITITDNCNNQTWGGQPFTISRRNFSLSTLANSCVDTAISLNFTLLLPEGSYLVTKQLTVNRDAYDFYRDSIYLPNNTCTSIGQFITQQKKVIATATTTCAPDCASCTASVGSWTDFLANYNKSIGLSAGDMTYQTEANAAYQDALSACASLCQTTTAANDIRSAMIQDMTPPYGQYADSSQAPGFDQYSIFYIKNNDTAFVPVFQLPGITYVDANGKPDSVYNPQSGLMVTPNTLSKEDFVQNFRTSWADALLPYHPEYCRLHVMENNNNSLLWDRKMQAVDTYSDAVAGGYLNPTNFNGAFPANTANIDPLSQVNTSIKNALNNTQKLYQTVKSPNIAMSMWGLACAMVKCDPSQQGQSCLMQYGVAFDQINTADWCTGDLDMAWRNFRQLYQGSKQQIFNQNLLVNPAGCSPANSRIYTSEPKVSSLLSTNHQSEFADITTTLANTSNLKDYTDAANSGPTKANNIAQGAQDSLALFYDNNCNAFAQQWMQQLSACTLYNPNDVKNIIIPGLIALCRKACDADHPYGASTLPAGVTVTVQGLACSSFQDIINHYNQANPGITDIIHCNAEVITSPLPYDNQPIYSSKPVYSRPTDCECGLITDFYNKYSLIHRNGETFSAFLLRTQQITMTEADLDNLVSMCSTTPTSASCRNLSHPINLPPAMQCHSGETCSSCQAIYSLYTAYKTQYPSMLPSDSSDADTAQSQKNTLFQNFMNNRLGYNLASWQYLQFMDTCAAHTADTTTTTVGTPPVAIESYFQSVNGTAGGYRSLSRSPDGSYYATGESSSIGASQTSGSIVHIGSNGNVLWERKYSNGSLGSVFEVLKATFDGGFIGAGQFTLPSNPGLWALMVVRGDASGNILWRKAIRWQGAYAWNADNLIQTHDGNFVLTANWAYNIVDPYPPLELVAKIDGSGNVLWTKGICDSLNHETNMYAISEINDTLFVTGSQSIGTNPQGGPLPQYGVFFKINEKTQTLSAPIYLTDTVLRDTSRWGTRLYDVYPMSSGYRIRTYSLSDSTIDVPGAADLDFSGNLVAYHQFVPPPAQSFEDGSPIDIGTSDGGWLHGGSYFIPIPGSVEVEGHTYWTKFNANWTPQWASDQALPGWQIPTQTIQNSDGSFTGVGYGLDLTPDFTPVSTLFKMPANGPSGCYSDTATPLTLIQPTAFIQINKPSLKSVDLSWTYLTDTAANVLMGGITAKTFNCGGPYYVNYNGPLLCGKSAPLLPPMTDSVTNCSDSLFFAVGTGTSLYKNYSDSLTGNFEKRYLDRCMQAYRHESFTVTHAESEYHYTLYYYDQAGNLLKTVPPAGVQQNTDSVWLSQVRAARAAKQKLTPTHMMVTNYRYNSLNQVAAQNSPDGGTSYFWYDRLGRLAVSQNGRQRLNNQYCYTQYDTIGRITQVGQVRSSTAITDAISRNEVPLLAWENNALSTADQITVTNYDVESSVIQPYVGQRNVRNRVSWTGLFNTAADMTEGSPSVASATYYSYDILGNVDTLLQDYGDVSGVPNPMNTTNNRFKKIVYDFDLVSGKVNNVAYQHGRVDAFYHTYLYDAENRITNVQSSTDSVNWDNDAFYIYYAHGPLARTILGQQQVQGINYGYTLPGWIKSINPTPYTGGSFTLRPDSAGNVVANSAYSLLLNYFDGDYKPINLGGSPDAGVSSALGGSYRPLYNGNISSMGVDIKKLNAPLLYNYQYDQLNRLVHMDAWHRAAAPWNALSLTTNYQENVTYDPNGNILTYNRNADSVNGTNEMDKLTYTYPTNSNQLDHISDDVTTVAHNDISGQSVGNYKYDAIGELISDNASHITNITWTVYGKIDSISKAGDTIIKYTYDAGGNRISKTLIHAGAKETTWYVRDARGNVVSVYTDGDPMVNGGNLAQTELHIYGSSRLGIWRRSVDVKSFSNTAVNPYPLLGDSVIFTRGNKLFELSNHLGNVLVTLSDKRYGVLVHDSTVGYFNPEVVAANDYYPFGMLQNNRSFKEGNAENYRYGFNGKENDNEVKGVGDQIDYGMRMYDPRIGKFLSLDPLAAKYSFYTPYQFSGNKPIWAVDLDGEEEKFSTGKKILNPGSTVLNISSKKAIYEFNQYKYKHPTGNYLKTDILKSESYNDISVKKQNSDAVAWFGEFAANSNNMKMPHEVNPTLTVTETSATTTATEIDLGRFGKYIQFETTTNTTEVDINGPAMQDNIKSIKKSTTTKISFQKVISDNDDGTLNVSFLPQDYWSDTYIHTENVSLTPKYSENLKKLPSALATQVDASNQENKEVMKKGIEAINDNHNEVEKKANNGDYVPKK